MKKFLWLLLIPALLCSQPYRKAYTDVSKTTAGSDVTDWVVLNKDIKQWSVFNGLLAFEFDVDSTGTTSGPSGGFAFVPEYYTITGATVVGDTIELQSAVSDLTLGGTLKWLKPSTAQVDTLYVDYRDPSTINDITDLPNIIRVRLRRYWMANTRCKYLYLGIVKY